MTCGKADKDFENFDMTPSEIFMKTLHHPSKRSIIFDICSCHIELSPFVLEQNSVHQNDSCVLLFPIEFHLKFGLGLIE